MTEEPKSSDQKVSFLSTSQPRSKRGLGWIPDRPDFRDYGEDHLEIREILEAGNSASSGKRTATPLRRKLGPTRSFAPLSARTRASDLPVSVDLRQYCSPVEDQGRLGSCTAHAGVGAIEYYERRAFGRHLDASRLFLYKVTRNLMKLRGDTGAYLRTTIGAMVLFGVPPESYWPYTDDATAFDREPKAFCYAFAQNFQTIKYFRHDPPASSPDRVLHRVKTYLAKGHPAMFGFTVYNSIEQAETTGCIPFPSPRERLEGGHAVLAVGYDDRLEITNTFSKQKTRGALLIRNSWGAAWGEDGYGWLPYDYVIKGLAQDFWSILKKEWVDTTAFSE
ncbi:MAG: C1 family peptidase [Candidatus Saccharicenans sp.]|uniref:C1 family peptidase n=1 Tax=Candidatus Saccharicenans sp. TaxID=2819258 RepID=UPI00404A32FA